VELIFVQPQMIGSYCTAIPVKTFRLINQHFETSVHNDSLIIALQKWPYLLILLLLLLRKFI